MTVNQLIMNAVKPTIPICVPDFYEGDETTYSIFVVNEIPNLYGNDSAVAMRSICTLNVFMPKKVNYLAAKRAICQALQSKGFTYPQVTNLTDSDGSRLVFEFEYTNGDV